MYTHLNTRIINRILLHNTEDNIDLIITSQF